MSLDVTLKSPEIKKAHCVHCGSEYDTSEVLYEDNITHNLGDMAVAAGIYRHLWRPEEIGITKAEQLIQPLKEGLNLLKALPEKFRQHNSPNGWGKYEDFVPFVENYWKACVDYPSAEIHVSR